jgi:hypothetical protein
LIIWLIFFLFLQTKRSFSPLFACWSQLDISATSDSVAALSEGYQLNYCWILKLLSGPRIFKLPNLCGNHLICMYTLAAYVFLPSFFGKNIPTAEFGMILAETACWDIERK